MEKKHYNWIIIGILTLLICGATISTIQSYKLRRLNNQLRERITDAEDTNRRLGETIEQCQSICGDLGQSVDRNIRTAREAVELIEEIRVQVQSLESITGGFDWNSYYEYWDSYLGIE